MSKIITQQLEKLNSISKKIYILKTELEPLLLANNVLDKHKEYLEDSLLKLPLTNLESNLKVILASLNKIKKTSKKIAKKKSDEGEGYATFQVDEKPKIIDRLDPNYKEITYDEIQRLHYEKNGCFISPIKRQTEFNYKGDCPRCGAPNMYVNNAGGNQMRCKCCLRKFGLKLYKHADITVVCPHCDRACERQKDKDSHYVYKCRHIDCSFFLNNVKLVKSGKGEHLKILSGNYKLHYTYRHYKLDFNELKKEGMLVKSGVDITNIRFSDRVFGLALTLSINYHLSFRETANLIYDLYNVKISHTTISRYIKIAANCLHYLVENYKYDLSSQLAGDETYVKSKGDNKYLFLFSDPATKIITSYYAFDNRDTTSAIKSMYQSIKKYESIPKKLSFVVDANPIYKSAQLYFKQHNINFNLYVVTGIKNNDKQSTKYRPFKQIEERLNRTFKTHYKGMNGFGSMHSLNDFMIVFTSFFNFLRRHSSLNFNTPVNHDFFEENDSMVSKWIKLIYKSFELQHNNFLYN